MLTGSLGNGSPAAQGGVIVVNEKLQAGTRKACKILNCTVPSTSGTWFYLTSLGQDPHQHNLSDARNAHWPISSTAAYSA